MAAEKLFNELLDSAYDSTNREDPLHQHKEEEETNDEGENKSRGLEEALVSCTKKKFSQEGTLTAAGTQQLLPILQWHHANLEFALGAPLANVSRMWWNFDDLCAYPGQHWALPAGSSPSLTPSKEIWMCDWDSACKRGAGDLALLLLPSRGAGWSPWFQSATSGLEDGFSTPPAPPPLP
ncbi:hypothetical protein GUITHDRAFT_131869 [Guillardia theta CCMP2712]|uniref:Uncharacterized protein n=1 Tax=Guillardia theta (strain CCMP2712) TaxID=905079 RepID=L1K2Q8_GUITC|nr:hypothetical protein GUITHDRAFT_131869 [Guillardia theta CCMP2712]EKX54879.1 hypothetical protein GUITHDRAFT_131869 [Guillardia theta CCMP2712]|eukprot:XP_005841859.1 hypothetical protein GUITHDRAFT_131869 [Guillardia theta CCMP2712]